MFDCLKAAKQTLEQTEGTHPIGEVQARGILAIGYALVSIAESLRGAELANPDGTDEEAR